MPFIAIILFGALAASFALMIELLGASLFSLSNQGLETLSFTTFLVLLCIAFIEESSKYIFLRQYAQRFFAKTKSNFNASLLLGAFFGLGFALLEASFLISAPAAHPFFIFLGTAAVHMATSIAFALFLFSSPDSSERRLSARSLIFFAVIFHTAYNLVSLLLF